MNVRRFPVLIVGAGVGGLATCALLANTGSRRFCWNGGGRSLSIRRPET